MLLVDHMLKTVEDKNVRLQLLFHHIESIRGTVYNQALFAEFEKTIHENAERGEPLTVDTLNGLMRMLYSRYSQQ